MVLPHFITPPGGRKVVTVRRTVQSKTRACCSSMVRLSTPDNVGRTPLQLALEHDRQDIATCLREHGECQWPVNMSIPALCQHYSS
jgi:hypothetical protein